MLLLFIHLNDGNNSASNTSQSIFGRRSGSEIRTEKRTKVDFDLLKCSMNSTESCLRIIKSLKLEILDWQREEDGSVSIKLNLTDSERKTLKSQLQARTAFQEDRGTEIQFSLQKIEEDLSVFERGDKKRAYPGYPDYAALTAFLNNMSSTFPHITKLFSIGKSVQGRELWGIKISDNPELNEAGEPEFKYIANMHGDEIVGREMTLNFIELLCTQYGKNDTITQLVNSTDIYIIPSMNPDGFQAGRRENAHGIDLNRNFPDRVTNPVNTIEGREPETVAMMRFTQAHNFILSANFHGGDVVANYPYDGRDSTGKCISPDDVLFTYLAKTYSYHHTTMWQSRTFPGGITRGCDWYDLYGGMQDWNYVFESCCEITVELSINKNPPYSTIPDFWNQNREAMLAYLQAIHNGVKGYVYDSQNNPLFAYLLVEGINHVVKTDPVHGDYYRLLTPGTYSITAFSEGFETQTQSVQVTQYNNPVRLDFYLKQSDNNQPQQKQQQIVDAGLNSFLVAPVIFVLIISLVLVFVSLILFCIIQYRARL